MRISVVSFFIRRISFCVVILLPQRTGTLVSFGPLQGNDSGTDWVNLPNDHPAYSAIFTSLLSSAANQRSFAATDIDLTTRPNVTLNSVGMLFGKDHPEG
jgi:hypothetical protein